MSTNTLSALTDVFAAPQQVFLSIRNRTLSPWWPLLILIASTLAVFGWYFFTIDLYPFMETSIQISGQVTSPEEIDLMLQNESVIRIASVASAGIGSLVVYLIVALYFFLAATLVAEEKFSFGQCLSLVAWGSLPGLISILSSAVSYGLADGFVYLTDIDKTSLASLLNMTYDEANFDVASALTVGNVWAYALYGYGFSVLTRSSVTTATIVGLIPPLLHYGLTYLL
ncbi:YIP1 family protein [Reinekea blandensis]|uniref:Yip1 domain-containing protein n=1 Tax=Reinekea blandensis MED297 TaxID=314283 RepID=A4BC46_9GAMM|nr:YIP1 family protein [Reinekea blandensis]EAR10531.1 hypothetical protein MED297_01880 [Reinekea sp. MED297] [Reinekea blandensis MED297]